MSTINDLSSRFPCWYRLNSKFKLLRNFTDGIDAVDAKERTIVKIEKEKPPPAPTPAPAPVRITKELDGYVGFANFPNQVYRKAIKKGFEFTLMVVGK